MRYAANEALDHSWQAEGGQRGPAGNVHRAIIHCNEKGPSPTPSAPLSVPTVLAGVRCLAPRIAFLDDARAAIKTSDVLKAVPGAFDRFWGMLVADAPLRFRPRQRRLGEIGRAHV